MFKLKANITLTGSYNKFIDKKDISRYLERIFTKFSDESVDDYEFVRNNKNCFDIYKNNIDCNISCNSYEKALQMAQVVLKLDNLSFLDYGFEVKLLELKEIEDTKLSDNIVTIGAY